MEIEKKYTVKRLPEDLNQYSSKKIEQGYLCTNPVVRIRKSNDDYILTYKSKFGIEKETQQAGCVSNEIEAPLTKDAYEHLKKKVDHHMVCKTRYIIPLEDGLIAELDLFTEHLEGLVFVEVEFPNIKAALSFIPPEWFDKEVSFDKRYKNNYLSTVDDFKDLGINSKEWL